ncbi:MAG: hypothetical protein C5B56_03535 [Proteobacteria bacterium]|nr:MAG: hypothetical protein C5B56_03535 [Pseudomonadota bacterium]
MSPAASTPSRAARSRSGRSSPMSPRPTPGRSFRPCRSPGTASSPISSTTSSMSPAARSSPTACPVSSRRWRPMRCSRLPSDEPAQRWQRVATRWLLTAAAVLGSLAFVLGAGNRLTRGPWFVYAPEVTLVPPFGRAAWERAFALHQQSPLYVLCGGYDVGGMESIDIYRLLYVWEWLRIASTVLLAVLLLALLVLALARTASSPRRPALWPWLGAVAAMLVYLGLRHLADHAGTFAVINIGQHRHALDLTFTSVGLAVLIVAALARERPAPGALAIRAAWARAVWAIAIALTIASGALVEALDARPLWTTFPGYADGLLPSADRLFAFHPLWRNLTENGYLVQASHRLISLGLWLGALLALASAWLRGRAWKRAALLFAFFTLEGMLGVAILRADDMLVWSVVHQILAVPILVVALAPADLFSRLRRSPAGETAMPQKHGAMLRPA